MRIGGFGGTAGLAEFLRLGEISACVDATHPYATTMSAHAVRACEVAAVPLARFVRPGWSHREQSPSWHWVDSYEQAMAAATTLGRRPFITTGRQTLVNFSGWTDRQVLVRVVEPLVVDVPKSWTVICDRGPYSHSGEIDVMSEHSIDVLLTKDSGGSFTAAKLEAAATLGVPIIVVARPLMDAFDNEFENVSETVAWLSGLHSAK